MQEPKTIFEAAYERNIPLKMPDIRRVILSDNPDYNTKTIDQQKEIISQYSSSEEKQLHLWTFMLAMQMRRRYQCGH